MYFQLATRKSDLPPTGLHWVAKDLVACVVPVSRTPLAIWSEEEHLVAGVTPRSRAQFAAGRDAARQAMVALGMPAVGIGRGTEGEPLFPTELRGSISHTRDHAVALVGLATDYGSVGVDLDDARALGDAAAAEITWELEVSRIQRAMNLADRAAAQNFAFSAKEAIFKCQYPLTLDAKLKAHQARLLETQAGVGGMSVSGWRAAKPTAVVLARMAVSRVALDTSPLAIATIAA